MDSRQKSKLTMCMVARDYLLLNTTVTSALPHFTEHFETLQSTITQIQAIAELQDIVRVGIAKTKKQLKEQLSSIAADNSRKLIAFANVTNNKILLAEIRNSESILKRISDVDLVTKAQEVYDRAQSNLAAVAAYGINATTQTTFLDIIHAFNAAIPKPRLGINERKQATQQLVVLFNTLHRALYTIDSLIEIVRLMHINFHNGYKTARKIINPTGSLAVKCLVTDAESGSPIKGVKVEFIQIPEMVELKSAHVQKSEAVIVKKTAEKGRCNIQTVPPGTYHVRVKKEGYADYVTTVSVNDKELCKLEIQMGKGG